MSQVTPAPETQEGGQRLCGSGQDVPRLNCQLGPKWLLPSSPQCGDRLDPARHSSSERSLPLDNFSLGED